MKQFLEAVSVTLDPLELLDESARYSTNCLDWQQMHPCTWFHIVTRI